MSYISGRKQGRSDLLFVLSAALREEINSEKNNEISKNPLTKN